MSSDVPPTCVGTLRATLVSMAAERRLLLATVSGLYLAGLTLLSYFAHEAWLAALVFFFFGTVVAGVTVLGVWAKAATPTRPPADVPSRKAERHMAFAGVAMYLATIAIAAAMPWSNRTRGASGTSFFCAFATAFLHPPAVVLVWHAHRVVWRPLLALAALLSTLLFSIFHVAHWVHSASFHTGAMLTVGGGFVQNGVGIRFTDAMPGIVGLQIVLWNSLLFLACSLHYVCGARDQCRNRGGPATLGNAPLNEESTLLNLSDHSMREDASGDSFGGRRVVAPRSQKAFVAAAFAVVVLSAFFAMVFPPIWNVPFPGYAYFPAYDVLFGKATGGLIVAKVRRWVPPLTDFVPHGGHLSFKIYPDTFAFYTLLVCLVVAGAAVQRFPPLRRCMHTPVASFTTVGELCVLMPCAAILVWWLVYWRFHYSRIANLPDREAWARTFGHMANYLLTFALFPVARNSLWDACFGIPFERAIRYHRAVALAWFAIVSVHFFTWMLVWMQQGTLSRILFNKRPCDLHMGGDTGHCDNFTILLVELMWVGATVMVALAHPWVRRNLFEVFFYAHHFFMVIVVVSLLHAWSLWFLLPVPIGLWLLDRGIRCRRSMGLCSVVEATTCPGGHVHLAVRPTHAMPWEAGQYAFIHVAEVSALQWHPFSLSTAPTATAPDGIPTMTFHIKSMGPGTFTGRLRQLVRAQEPLTIRVDGGYGRPSLRLDADYDTVVLVAGGIGVTPMHALLQSFTTHAPHSDANTDAQHPQHNTPSLNANAPRDAVATKKARPLRRLREVHFVWSVRDAEVVTMFQDSLAAIQHGFAVRRRGSPFHQPSPISSANRLEVPSNTSIGGGGGSGGEVMANRYEPKVVLHIHVTTARVAPPWGTVDGVPLLAGRPDVRALLHAATTAPMEEGDPATRPSVAVAVCGPGPLVDSVRSEARRARCAFHAETFEL